MFSFLNCVHIQRWRIKKWIARHPSVPKQDAKSHLCTVLLPREESNTGSAFQTDPTWDYHDWFWRNWWRIFFIYINVFRSVRYIFSPVVRTFNIHSMWSLWPQTQRQDFKFTLFLKQQGKVRWPCKEFTHSLSFSEQGGMHIWTICRP